MDEFDQEQNRSEGFSKFLPSIQSGESLDACSASQVPSSSLSSPVTQLSPQQPKIEPALLSEKPQRKKPKNARGTRRKKVPTAKNQALIPYRHTEMRHRLRHVCNMFTGIHGRKDRQTDGDSQTNAEQMQRHTALVCAHIHTCRV